MSLDPKQQVKAPQPSEAFQCLQLEMAAAERREVRAWASGFVVGMSTCLVIAVIFELIYQ